MENVENYDDCHYFYEDEVSILTFTTKIHICIFNLNKWVLQVYRVNRRSGQVEFGMVVENSELYSSDEEESNDQQQQQDHRGRQRGRQQRDGGEEDDSRLKKGFVRVAWYPKGDEQVT